MKTLCQIGLVNHTWKRVYTAEKSVLRCKKCKHVYCAEILAQSTCPRDGEVLESEKHWYRVCTECGVQG